MAESMARLSSTAGDQGSIPIASRNDFDFPPHMRVLAMVALLAFWHTVYATDLPIPVLNRSDVVFMYEAKAETYAAYGATVLAWGGTPTAESLKEAAGLKFFASVGMVTEFARYMDRFPETYEQGLCRDLEGKPYKVPWLTDHQHKGVPFWWCCTRQPVFREYISERVVQTVKAGADGVHIDDHLGTAGALWTGGCFCDRCMVEFRDELKRDTPAGVQPDTFDYRQELRRWLADKPERKFYHHPLWPRWRAYQLRGAAAFMQQLRQLAAKTAGKPVPISANAGLTWGSHLNDFNSLDFFSAEVEHHAEGLKFSDAPLVAYRMADAVNRPLASTASGQDWAFIKERNLPGLVQGWIVLGYAAGHSLMAPNRQWCYTKEKGTHWYEGPRQKYAPLYRFVRENPDLFDGYTTYADLTVAYAQRTFDRDSAALMNLCHSLVTSNISYSLALGGDDVVLHPLDGKALSAANKVLVLKFEDFSEQDRKTITGIAHERRLQDANAARQVRPAVRIEGAVPVVALPRVKSGSAALHLVHWGYDAEPDGVEPLRDVKLIVGADKLGLPGATAATVYSPGKPPKDVELKDGTVLLPEVGLWTVLRLNAKK